MMKKNNRRAASVVTVLIGLAGFSGAAHARYIQADPTGLAAGPNLYSYAGQNPTQAIDPSGLDLLLITGTQRNDDSINIFGHSSIAVTGSGLYSYGTSTPLGSSTTDFLQEQAAARGQTLTIIKTTPEQDAAALKYLAEHTSKIGVLEDNCSSRTKGAIEAAGMNLPTTGIDTPDKVADAAAALSNARNVSIPLNGNVPDDLKRFNPYTLPAPPQSQSGQ